MLADKDKFNDVVLIAGGGRSISGGDRSFRSSYLQNDANLLGMRSTQGSSRAAAMHDANGRQSSNGRGVSKAILGQRKNTNYESIRARLNWQNAVRLVCLPTPAIMTPIR